MPKGARHGDSSSGKGKGKMVNSGVNKRRGAQLTAKNVSKVVESVASSSRPLRATRFYKKSSLVHDDDLPMEVIEKPDPAVPVEGGTNIAQLSDELLIQMFSQVDSQTICRCINRVCKRWNNLGKDKYLWSDIDLSFTTLTPVYLKSVTKQYCSDATTRLSIRAPSKRYYDDGTSRKMLSAPKCLTRSNLEGIKRKCPSLKSLTISYEQINKSLNGKDLTFSHGLPSNLTHLSLAYCNLVMEQFHSLLHKDSPLSCLTDLDLTGVLLVRLLYSAPSHHFPSSLLKLTLRDSELPLNDGSFIDLFEQDCKLQCLDISVTKIGLGSLQSLADKLSNLREMNMCGCLIAEDHESALEADYEQMEEENWHDLWLEGFQSVERLNLRNSTQNNGSPLPPVMQKLCGKVNHIIDTEGTTHGEWSKHEWKDVDESEITKFDFDKREQEEAKNLRFYRSSMFRRSLRYIDFLDDPHYDDMYEGYHPGGYDSDSGDDCSIM